MSGRLLIACALVVSGFGCSFGSEVEFKAFHRGLEKNFRPGACSRTEVTTEISQSEGSSSQTSVRSISLQLGDSYVLETQGKQGRVVASNQRYAFCLESMTPGGKWALESLNFHDSETNLSKPDPRATVNRGAEHAWNKVNVWSIDQYLEVPGVQATWSNESDGVVKLVIGIPDTNAIVPGTGLRVQLAQVSAQFKPKDQDGVVYDYKFSDFRKVGEFSVPHARQFKRIVPGNVIPSRTSETMFKYSDELPPPERFLVSYYGFEEPGASYFPWRRLAPLLLAITVIGIRIFVARKGRKTVEEPV
jgi:hypothetical protein